MEIENVKLNQKVIIVATGATGKVKDYDKVCVKVNGEWYLPGELESSVENFINDAKAAAVINLLLMLIPLLLVIGSLDKPIALPRAVNNFCVCGCAALVITVIVTLYSVYVNFFKGGQK